MGLHNFGSHCRCGCSLPSVDYSQPAVPNPDLRKFNIRRVQEVRGNTVVEVVYPGATNYEGRKIMVYRCSKEKVLRSTSLDPHFCEDPNCLSPFARFEPTDAGWRAALDMAGELRMYR
jgi:hypothetical protein